MSTGGGEAAWKPFDHLGSSIEDVLFEVSDASLGLLKRSGVVTWQNKTKKRVRMQNFAISVLCNETLVCTPMFTSSQAHNGFNVYM